MKKRIIILAVCSFVMFTACNKSSENVITEETTTTAVVASSEVTTVEISETIVQTTVNTEEDSSAEEAEKQIANEEMLKQNKQEETSQTASIEYEVLNPFEYMFVTASDVGLPEIGLSYSISPREAVIDSQFGTDVEFWYNFIVNSEDPQTLTYIKEGDVVTIEFTCDEDYLKEHYNTVVEETTMTFVAWHPGNKNYMYIENGEMCYTEDVSIVLGI